MVRSLLLALALVAVSLPTDVVAQGRSGKAKGGGPAFCRSGAGHPVHGWEWCRQRGWDGRVNTSNRSIRRDDVRQRDPYFGRYGDSRMDDGAFGNGYGDGYEKGLDDARDGRNYDPTRHSWYRSADRHYDSRYGSRAQYANQYRSGFRSGYEEGFADGDRYGDRNDTDGRTSRFPWPF
jgi:hypothetical protein